MAIVRLLRTLFFLPGKFHLSAGTNLNPLENNGIYPEIAVPVYNRFPFPFRRRRPVDFMPKANMMCLVLVVMSSAKVMAGTITVTGSPVATMTTTYGTASPTPQTFTVSGTGLGGGRALVVAAPPAGYEISSTAATGPYVTTSITFNANGGGTVGVKTIWIRLAATATVGNYSGTIAVTSTGALVPGSVVLTPSSTVTPAAITLTAKAQTKTYGSTFTFSGTQYTITAGSLKNSDAITSVSYACGGSAATATVAGSPYVITPSGATGTGNFSTTNYTITYVNANMTVNKAPLSIVANNQSKTYGNTFTFAGTEFTTGGLQNSDNVTSVTITSPGAVSTAAAGTSLMCYYYKWFGGWERFGELSHRL